MAGSATITGTQNYVMGIGHPKTEATTEAPPAVFSIDPLTGEIAGLLGLPLTTGPATFVAFGDSITLGADTGGRCDNSFVTWGLGLALGRATLLYNAGVSGNTVAQMFARITTDVLAYTPQWVTVMGGINSINAGTTAALVWDDATNGGLKQIYAALRAKGIRVIALSILPLASGHPSYSAANVEKALVVNQKIKDYCRVTPGMYFVDAYSQIVDPTSLTGLPLANMIDTGNIHPTASGARKIGVKLAAAINSAIPAWDDLPSSYVDSYLFSAANSNRAPNPTFAGSGGTTLNSGSGTSTGTVANSWNSGSNSGAGAINCVSSVVSRADALGNNQRVVCTSAALNDACAIRTGNINANFAIGDTVYGEASIKVTGMSAIQAIRFYIQYKVDAGAYVYVYGMANSTTTCDTTDLSEVVFRTPNLTFAGTTINEVYLVAQVIFTGVGGATLEMGRAQLRKVS